MGQQANTIYRLALPSGAGTTKRRNFKRDIATLQQVNPQWAVIPDWTQPGEEKAFIILYKDKNYAYRLTSYKIEMALSKSFLRGYGS